MIPSIKPPAGNPAPPTQPSALPDMRHKRPLTPTEWWDVFNKSEYKGAPGCVIVSYGTLHAFEDSVSALAAPRIAAAPPTGPDEIHILHMDTITLMLEKAEKRALVGALDWLSAKSKESQAYADAYQKLGEYVMDLPETLPASSQPAEDLVLRPPSSQGPESPVAKLSADEIIEACALAIKTIICNQPSCRKSARAAVRKLKGTLALAKGNSQSEVEAEAATKKEQS